MRCLHARLGISHKPSAKQFQKQKKTVFLPNVNHSRFHLRYDMVRQCIALSCTLEHTHSLTYSQAQVRRIWELAFDLYGTDWACGNCANGPLQFPFVYECDLHLSFRIRWISLFATATTTTAALKTVPADAVNGNLTIQHTGAQSEKNKKWYFNRDDDTLTDLKNTHT